LIPNRQLKLYLRNTNLERVLARHPNGIFVAPIEQGEIGSDLFRLQASQLLQFRRRRHAYGQRQNTLSTKCTSTPSPSKARSPTKKSPPQIRFHPEGLLTNSTLSRAPLWA
jgi:hypothetical protein